MIEQKGDNSTSNRPMQGSLQTNIPPSIMLEVHHVMDNVARQYPTTEGSMTITADEFVATYQALKESTGPQGSSSN
jgi:hypothetical protein